MADPNVSPQLSHLSADDLRELVELYYGNDFTVTELLEIFEISAPASQLVALFPPYEDLKLLCPYCKIPMLRKWVSRASSGKGRLTSDSYCSQCGHQDFGSENRWQHCNCQYCLQNAQLQVKRKNTLEWEKIYRVFGRERRFNFSGDIMEIDLRTVIYLLAMERQSVSGEIGIFSPQDEAETLCTPDYNFTFDIIKHLTKSEHMHVDPCSQRKAFDVDESIYYYLGYAQYYADLGLSLQETKASLRALEATFRNKTWSHRWCSEWREVIRDVWRELSIGECLQYLIEIGRERDFDMPHGDKTRAVLSDALVDHPISVVYASIWSAVVRASDYYQSSNVSKKQAANSVIGNIQRNIEKLRLGVWEKKSYGRYKKCRQSALYDVLFNLILQIGDDGFNKTFDDCFPYLTWIDAAVTGEK